jgi:hypothetical protein
MKPRISAMTVLLIGFLLFAFTALYVTYQIVTGPEYKLTSGEAWSRAMDDAKAQFNAYRR